jgi:threonine aldolase
MRQSGLLAAAGLHALAHHRERLPEDHANAKRMAEMLAGEPGLEVDPARVETNIVMIDIAPPRSAQALVAACGERGVRISAITSKRLRLVTHMDVDRAACEKAADVLIKAARFA